MEQAVLDEILAIDFEEIPDAPDDMTAVQMLAVCFAVWDKPLEYMERFLVIKTKSNELVKFRLNFVQRWVLTVIMELWEAGVPVRLIVLKARQFGVSTFIEGLCFMLTANTPNTTMWVIAHDRSSSNNLYGMTELYLDELPEQITPMVRNRDFKRIRFDNPDPKKRKTEPGLKSRILVSQAGDVRAGRSDTITFLHISERAFWDEKGRKTIGSLLQAVPQHPRTIIVQESTANGVEDPAGFHRLWKRSYGVPNSEWRAIFFPWFIHDEYRRKVEGYELDSEGRLVLQPDPDGEMREEHLRDGVDWIDPHGNAITYYVDDEQLAWRRWCIEVNCEGDIFLFLQEYPSNPEEAFVQSGNPWFDRAGMAYQEKQLRPPRATGTFRTPPPANWRSGPDRCVWREDHYHPREARDGVCPPEFLPLDNGEWWLWELPRPGEEYLVSVDTSEGVEEGSGAAIEVLHRRTLAQVAEFSGMLDTDLLAHQAAMAAHYYNGAWSIPEVNNTGYGFMVTFEALWARIFFRKNPDAPMGGKDTWVRGFKTTTVTRPILVTRGRNYIREKVPTVRSSRLFGQMQTFVKDNKGVPRAAGKNKDDLVMAWLIDLELSEARPIRLEKPQAEPTLLDDASFKAHMKRMGRRSYLREKPKFY